MADDEIPIGTETTEPVVPEIASDAVAELPPVPVAAEPAPAEPVPAVKARKPRAVKAKPVIAEPEPVAPKPVAVRKAPAPKPVKKPVAKAAPQPKPAKIPAANPGVPTIKPVSETVAMTTDFTEFFKSTFADVQEKTKAAYEKSTASFGEAGAFAQGNVEAMVESTKIFAEGLQKLGASLVADSKETFEGLTTEVKELTAVKSPADFFKLQSELMKKYFDTSVAYSSKQSEAMMKLATDATAPISRRVSLAVEKMKAA